MFLGGLQVTCEVCTPPYLCTWAAVLDVQRYFTQVSLITRFPQKGHDANIFIVTREWVVSIELCF